MDFWITWSKKCLETARGQNRAVRIITRPNYASIPSYNQ